MLVFNDVNLKVDLSNVDSQWTPSAMLSATQSADGYGVNKHQHREKLQATMNKPVGKHRTVCGIQYQHDTDSVVVIDYDVNANDVDTDAIQEMKDVEDENAMNEIFDEE